MLSKWARFQLTAKNQTNDNDSVQQRHESKVCWIKRDRTEKNIRLCIHPLFKEGQQRYGEHTDLWEAC